ncbi:MAG: type I glyceraldehyde-3-phosphate dehydrogenase [Patescibacteria group bacterium]
MMKVAINGFGRIGRAFLRASIGEKGIDIVAINDLGDLENLAYLLKYDSAYGVSDLKIEVKKEDSEVVINDNVIKFFQEKEPQNLPWGKLDVDVVVECTGMFASYEKSQTHLDAGAKRVVISAPVKDTSDIGETILLGINDEKLKKCKISSNASCTTNAGSPILAILSDKLGVEKAILNTVHGYTSSQKLVDSPDKKDWRRGRAGAVNIVPSSTGAAIATTKAIESLSGKFDGIAIRVPVLTGSLVDITFLSSRNTSRDEVNEILEEASRDKKWEDIFTTTREALVSNDIVGTKYASIADLSLTRVVDNNLVKVLAWYDNESGYANLLLKHVLEIKKYL